MTRRRLRAGCLAVIALVVLGEIGVRVWDGLHSGTGSLYDHIVTIGARYKMRPGQVTVPERYGDILYRFNRDGYRDDDPAPGTRRRIVLLGDSVSFGLGVDQDEIFAARLERLLQRELEQPWEVLNLGIFAYHTANELAAFEADGLRYRPELVIVQFYMNDFAISSLKAGPAGTFFDRLAAVRNRLLYRSALWRRVHQAATGLTFALAHDVRRLRFPETLNDAEPRGKRAYLATTPDERVEAFAALRQIRDAAQRGGARLLVVLSPDEVQLFDRGYDMIGNRLRGFCAREGIDFLDLLPALRATPDRHTLFNDGVHYSPRGHDRVARILFAELVRRRLV